MVSAPDILFITLISHSLLKLLLFFPLLLTLQLVSYTPYIRQLSEEGKGIKNNILWRLFFPSHAGYGARRPFFPVQIEILENKSNDGPVLEPDGALPAALQNRTQLRESRSF